MNEWQKRGKEEDKNKDEVTRQNMIKCNIYYWLRELKNW